ncbi:MAG: hypothetical protein KKH08_04360, partial [Candidatus Omnitrophica bacterium]|nr:hypothetical protein [Candidatus Omnitrophota bacterium]
KNYVQELTQNGYDVIVVDMRGNAVDTNGDNNPDAPVVGSSWAYGVNDLGDDVGTALAYGIDYLNKNLPGRDYQKADVVTHSTGALAVTSYSRSQGLVPYRNNIDTVIELAPPNNGSTSLVANIRESAQMIPSVFAQSMVAYQYALDFIADKVWIPGGRMESESLRRQLMPESLFLKSIEGLGPAPGITTLIAIGDEDWVVGDWSPVIKEREDIGYEYFMGLDHFNFCGSELIITALLDRLEKGAESDFFNRYKPYRNKSLLAFLSGPGIDHPDDTFDVVTFASGIVITPRELFDLYLRIAGRKDKTHLLRYWEALSCFEDAQEEIDNGSGESVIIDKWKNLLAEKNESLQDDYADASKEYEECPDIAVLANGYYIELVKLIIEKAGEPVRIVDHTFNPAIVNEQKLLLIPSGGLSGLSYSPIFRKKISEFVKNGGTIACFSQQYGYDFAALPAGGLNGYGWQEDVSCHSSAAYIESFHQILSSQTALCPDFKLDGYFTEYPEDAEILLRRSKNLMPAMLIYNFGQGRVIAASLYSDWGYSNGQTSTSEINLIRDLIRWSKSAGPLPEYESGKIFEEAFQVSKDFSEIETILSAPDGAVLEKKLSNSPRFESETILTKPGIYSVDYILYGPDSEIIQPRTEGFYFCVSDPPEGSVADPDFTFDITSDSESYIKDTEVVFTFHLRNNTAKDENIKCKAEFTHHDSKLTQSIVVPAGSRVSFDKNISMDKTDRVMANFYSSGNYFLGRAERGVGVYEPKVEVILSTDKTQYIPGQTVAIECAAENNSETAIDLLFALNIVDSGNSGAYYDSKVLRLDKDENISWDREFEIPRDAVRGIYRIKLNAFSNSNLVGSKSVDIDIPAPLIYDDELPADFFEALKIELSKFVYLPGETIFAEAIITNKGEKLESAVLDISVLPGAEIGSLFGTVKDKEDFPVEGALVNTVYTNIDGKYKLKNIDRGKYSFSVRANGYNSLSEEIDILGGENTFDAELESTEYGNLSCVFADSIGSYLTLNPVDVVGSDACVRYAVISSEGIFEFKHLPSGLYELYTQPEDITEPIQI